MIVIHKDVCGWGRESTPTGSIWATSPRLLEEESQRLLVRANISISTSTTTSIMAFSGTGRCWCRVVVVAAVCAVLSGIPAFGSAYGVRAQCLAGYYQNVTDGGTCVLCTGHVEDVVQRGAPFPPDGTLRPGSVAVSGSGDTIALGFPSVTVNGDDHRGIVRVYSWDGEAWVAKGGDIEGLRFGFFGTVVALSDDGNTVAASAPAALYGTISTSGAVYAFTWDGSSWLRKGPTFAPESSGQYHFGNAMGLSASGNVLVVAEFFPLKSGPVARAFVYVWFTNVGGWLQRAVLVGPSVTAFYSRKFSVVISSDGNVIAIGSPSATSSRSEGAIFVYEWVSRDLVYERVGDPVVGLVGEGFGSSVALSGDGLVLAVGTVRRSASGQWSGGVRVFGRDGQAWVPMGSVINGASMFGYAGRSVALSGDGQVLLVPSRGNDSNTGILTVYLWVSGVWVAARGRDSREILWKRIRDGRGSEQRWHCSCRC